MTIPEKVNKMVRGGGSAAFSGRAEMKNGIQTAQSGMEAGAQMMIGALLGRGPPRSAAHRWCCCGVPTLNKSHPDPRSSQVDS